MQVFVFFRPSTEIEYSRAIFYTIHRLCGISTFSTYSYIHSKICKSWNKYIKTHETISTSCPPQGSLIIPSLLLTYSYSSPCPPTHPPLNTRHKRVYIFSYLHRHLNTVLSSENYIFIWYTSFIARCAMYKLWLQRKLIV